MRIAHNISTLNTLNKLNKNNKAIGNSLEKLSSGLRINRAADDAAGLAISEKMRAQIRGLEQAERNIQDGISLIQTAEGGLAGIQDYLQRARELAVQAANNTLTDADRQQIQKEVEQIKQGINQIANNTKFNGIELLNASTTSISTTPSFDWFKVNANITGQISGIIWDGSQFVAVTNDGGGSNGLGGVWSSIDGITWNNQASGISEGLLDIEYNGSQYVAVGYDGKIMTSNDSVTWMTQTSGTTEDIYGVLWNGSKYVATGTMGTILTSVDGINWSVENSGTNEWLWDAAWGNNQFVAVGDNGTILTSSDGINWTTQTSGTSVILTGVSWENGQFFASGGNGTILTSSDGITWTSHITGTTQVIETVKWDGSKYIAVGTNGTILTSSDGNTWVNESTETTHHLHDVVNNGNKNIVIGNSGTILTDKLSNSSVTTIKDLKLQVGANSGNNFNVILTDARTTRLRIDDISVDQRSSAEEAIYKIDEAIQKVSSERAKFGAYQNALEHIHHNVANYKVNLTASASRIRDVDMAKEMMEFTKNNILIQASQAMLAQADLQPQAILQLLNSY